MTITATCGASDCEGQSSRVADLEALAAWMSAHGYHEIARSLHDEADAVRDRERRP